MAFGAQLFIKIASLLSIAAQHPRRSLMSSSLMRAQRREAEKMSEIRRAAAEQERKRQFLEALETKKHRLEKNARDDAEREKVLLDKLSRKPKLKARPGINEFFKEKELTIWEKRTLEKNYTDALKSKAKSKAEYRQAVAVAEAKRNTEIINERDRLERTRKEMEQRDSVETKRLKKERSDGALLLEDNLYALGQESHLSWVRQLPASTRANWGVPYFALLVVCDGQRPASSFERLVASLLTADYLGERIDLYVHVDHGPHQLDVAASAGAVDWPFGARNVTAHRTRLGLAHTTLEAWSPRSEDEVALVFEDSHEVSPLFFAWAKRAVLTYRYDPAQQFASTRLVGVSLYTPKISTTQFPLPFRPRDFAAGPYLHQLPCGGGAFALFADAWRELQRYADLRMTWEGDKGSGGGLTAHLSSRSGEPSRTNGRHWKWLYLLELSASRNYFFLYPNFPDGASFATSHLSGHRGGGGVDGPSLFGVPLLGRRDMADFVVHLLPGLDDLVRLDVFNDPIAAAHPTDWDDGGIKRRAEVGAGDGNQAVVEWRAGAGSCFDFDSAPGWDSTFLDVAVVVRPHWGSAAVGPVMPGRVVTVEDAHRALFPALAQWRRPSVVVLAVPGSVDAALRELAMSRFLKPRLLLARNADVGPAAKYVAALTALSAWSRTGRLVDRPVGLLALHEGEVYKPDLLCRHLQAYASPAHAKALGLAPLRWRLDEAPPFMADPETTARPLDPEPRAFQQLCSANNPPGLALSGPGAGVFAPLNLVAGCLGWAAR